MAGFASDVRPLELGISAVLALGQAGRLVAHPRRAERRPRSRTCHHRRDDRPGAPTCGRRKRGLQAQAIGRSRGGLSTKIHIAVDALGNPLRLILTPGQVNDCTQAEALIDGLPATYVLADRAYDTDRIRAYLAFRAEAVIPAKSTRKQPVPHDQHLYKERHLVECFINKIKHFRRVATRYDKTTAAFLAFVAIASFMVWLR
jgi:transposase